MPYEYPGILEVLDKDPAIASASAIVLMGLKTFITGMFISLV
jgi:hypothetical protein